MINLEAAGLSPTETKCYEALISQESWKPSELAKHISETRTNCYKLLDSLVSKGLADRFEQDNKFHYRAEPPDRLLDIADDRLQQLNSSQKELSLYVEQLAASYMAIHDKPFVQLLNDEQALKLHLAESQTTIRHFPLETIKDSQPILIAAQKERVIIIADKDPLQGIVINHPGIAEAFRLLLSQ